MAQSGLDREQIRIERVSRDVYDNVSESRNFSLISPGAMVVMHGNAELSGAKRRCCGKLVVAPEILLYV